MPHAPSASALSKGFAVFVFLCGSVYEGFGKNDWTEAAKLFGLASATAGFAATGAKLRTDVTAIKAETDPPAGAAPPDPTPLPVEEHFDRGY